MVLRIGTSGWHYPHWIGVFYPEDLETSRLLPHYAEVFDTVEINNTFYHLPSESTFQNWKRSTPRGFCFAVKASRLLTHLKKLRDAERPLANFLDRVRILREKLGPILFQLPPRWRCNLERLDAFLKVLPAGHRYAFEFRDTSWHQPAVYSLLERYGAAFCIYHLAGTQSPLHLTADFCYIRLHGPDGAYQGSYSATALKAWAGRIQQWERQVKAVYCYFDNDQEGYAADNARTLKQLLLDRSEEFA